MKNLVSFIIFCFFSLLMIAKPVFADAYSGSSSAVEPTTTIHSSENSSTISGSSPPSSITENTASSITTAEPSTSSAPTSSTEDSTTTTASSTTITSSISSRTSTSTLTSTSTTIPVCKDCKTRCCACEYDDEVWSDNSKPNCDKAPDAVTCYSTDVWIYHEELRTDCEWIEPSGNKCGNNPNYDCYYTWSDRDEIWGAWSGNKPCCKMPPLSQPGPNDATLSQFCCAGPPNGRCVNRFQNDCQKWALAPEQADCSAVVVTNYTVETNPFESLNSCNSFRYKHSGHGTGSCEDPFIKLAAFCSNINGNVDSQCPIDINVDWLGCQTFSDVEQAKIYAQAYQKLLADSLGNVPFIAQVSGSQCDSLLEDNPTCSTRYTFSIKYTEIAEGADKCFTSKENQECDASLIGEGSSFVCAVKEESPPFGKQFCCCETDDDGEKKCSYKLLTLEKLVIDANAKGIEIRDSDSVTCGDPILD